MGDLGIGKPYYHGEDEFDGIEGFLYDFESYGMSKRASDDNWDVLKIAIVKKIKGISKDERIGIYDDLEVKITELVQMKQKEDESVEMYTYCFDTCVEPVENIVNEDDII
ncbi:7089_t:CDS:2, partial [Dentiscutata erythropus]